MDDEVMLCCNQGSTGIVDVAAGADVGIGTADLAIVVGKTGSAQVHILMCKHNTTVVVDASTSIELAGTCC